MNSNNDSYGPLSVHDKAYLFFPSDKQQKTEFTKKGIRFFYYGQIEHDEYQKRKLYQFKEYVVKNKVYYNKDFLDDQRILLFLQSNGYKPKETLQAIEDNMIFLKYYLPVDFSRAEKMIRSGFFYPCGRDKQFRPVLVFNATLMDFKDIENGIVATCFVHETIIANMFLPGQIENWNVIYDLGGMGITEIPISAIKTTTRKMSSNYGGRLFRMFTVNAPGTIWFAWKAVSAFLDKVTVEKIKISKDHTDKSMFDNIHPSQVEEKYGGTQPNRKEYWPFKIPEAVYDEKRLISMGEYEAKLNNGELKRNIVHPLFCQKKQQKKFK